MREEWGGLARFASSLAPSRVPPASRSRLPDGTGTGAVEPVRRVRDGVTDGPPEPPSESRAASEPGTGGPRRSSKMVALRCQAAARVPGIERVRLLEAGGVGVGADEQGRLDGRRDARRVLADGADGRALLGGGDRRARVVASIVQVREALAVHRGGGCRSNMHGNNMVTRFGQRPAGQPSSVRSAR